MADNTIFEGRVSIIDNVDVVNNGYGDLTVSRLVRVPSVYLPVGGNEVRLQADPGLSGSYTYSFPNAGPTADGQIIISSGGGLTNEYYEIHPTYEVWVRKNPSVGEYSSLSAALASIPLVGPTSPSASTPWVVRISPGVYIEPAAIALRSYVSVVGSLSSSTQLIADVGIAGSVFVTGAPYSTITGVTLACVDYLFAPSYLVEYLGDPLGLYFKCVDVIFDTSSNVIHVGSTLGPCLFTISDILINMSAPFTRAFYIEDSGPSNYPITFSLSGLLWGADAAGLANFISIFEITSFKSPSVVPNVFAVITGSTMGTNSFGPAGSGFILSGSVYCVIESCLFGGMNTGLSILSSAESTFLILTTSTLSDNVTDISITSTVAFGTISVNATLSKVTINPSANFGVQINDPTGGIAFSGNMYQGLEWNSITNISEQIQHGAVCGIIGGQTVIASAGGLNISVAGGAGYVFTTKLIYVTWIAVGSLVVPDNTLSWIYVNSTGVVAVVGSEPDSISNIILGTVKTYGGGITYIQEIGHVLDNLASNVDNVMRNVWGPVVKSGCLASSGSDIGSRAVQVSSGSYSLGVSQYSPIGGDNVSMIGYYGGSVETAPFTNIPLMWDNAGVLTAIGAGMWVKHAVYILSSLSGITQYFFVYGQMEFATELDAQVGSIPTPPSSFTANMCPVAGVVVTDSDPSSPLTASRFRDIRPTLGFRSEGATASADHNSLLNLTVGNAHPQYFRVDGTSTMTGNVSLGANNIVGSGGNLLNGVDLLAHASRHLPGGADALATAAPVGVGAANAIGAAASFARSDHVHAGVSSWTGGTTGLTPVGSTTGPITLGGTLVVGNGGTGQTTFDTGSLLLGNGSSALSALADVATGSVLTSGGIGVNPMWTAYTASPTTSTVVSRDTNGNSSFNNVLCNYTSTVTAGGTTTLTVASTYFQYFTGALAQTIVLPVTSTLILGQSYQIINNSTGMITIQSSGLNNIITLSTNQAVQFTCILITGTDSSSWSYQTLGKSLKPTTSAIISSISITNVLTLATSTFAIPANYIVPGHVFQIECTGFATTNTAGAGCLFQVRIGSTNSSSDTLVASDGLGAAAGAGYFKYICTITWRSTTSVITVFEWWGTGQGLTTAISWINGGSVTTVSNTSTTYITLFARSGASNNIITFYQSLISQV